MPEYPYPREGAVNSDKLKAELVAITAAVAGVNTAAGLVTVITTTALSQQQQTDVGAAITAHNPALTNAQQQEKDIQEALDAIEQGMLYLRNQLISPTPHTPTQIVSNIKPVVDGNVYLLNTVNNFIDLMVFSRSWVAADVKTPTTNPNRGKYIEAVIILFGVKTG